MANISYERYLYESSIEPDVKVDIEYTATYDKTKNCTVVQIDQVTHTLRNQGQYYYSVESTIQIASKDNPSSEMQIIAVDRGVSTHGSNYISTEIITCVPEANIVVIQHAPTRGQKEIVLTCLTRANIKSHTAYNREIIYCPESPKVENIIVGTNTHIVGNKNEFYTDRTNFLAYSSVVTDFDLSYSQDYTIFPINSIQYISNYNEKTNQTTITFLNGKSQAWQSGPNFLRGRIIMEIAPLDNLEDKQTVCFFGRDGEASGTKYRTFDMFYTDVIEDLQSATATDIASYSIVIQHTSKERGERGIHISLTSQHLIWVLPSGSTQYYYDWKPSATFEKNIVTGVFGYPATTYIYINGQYVPCKCYIENGIEWIPHRVYLDIGTKWIT